MKKIGFVLVFVLVVLGCSACSVKLTVDKAENADKQETVVVQTVEPTETLEENVDAESEAFIISDLNEVHAFYGVWCIGSKNEVVAKATATDLKAAGFNAKVFVTTDWENLNSEKFYVVTADVCETKQEAEQVLHRVKESGYTDAYIKYSDNKQ